MKEIGLSYSTVKGIILSKGLLWQYYDSYQTYIVFALENNLAWTAIVAKDGGADQVDFETYYKGIANQLTSVYAIASQGAANTLGGAWPIKVTDGTNVTALSPSGALKVSNGLFPESDKAKLYSASFDVNLPSGSSQTNIALIRNPSGSNKLMRIVEIGTDISNTISSAAFYRLYISPTVTANGASQSSVSLYLGGGAPTSVMQIYAGPSTSAVGTRIDTWYSTGGASGTGYVSEFDGMLTLAENQRLLLTGTPDGTNRNTMVTIWWLEE